MYKWKEFVKKKQLVEADVKFNQFPQKDSSLLNNTYFSNILDDGNYTKEEIVEFVLLAAKFTFHLVDEEIKPYVQRCIDTMEQWLKNPESISRTQALNIGDEAHTMSTYQYMGNVNYANLVASYGTNVIAMKNPFFYAGWAATYAIRVDPSVESKLMQYLHSIDKRHNNHFDKRNNEDQLKGFLQDLSSNEPIQSKHDTIQIFLDFLEDYGISNIRNLGHFSVDPKDQNSIFNNQLVLNNFLRMIQNRIS